MDLSHAPSLPPFDWRVIYADPTVAFYEARREDAMQAMTRDGLALAGPFTPEQYEQALAVNTRWGCILFDDDDEVAKAEATVMRALEPYVLGGRNG